MAHLVCKLKSYIQPFENELAFRELCQLSGVDAPRIVDVDSNTFGIETDVSKSILAKNLTYWEYVEARSNRIFTDQSLKEATGLIGRNGTDLEGIKDAIPFQGEIALPNRRSLRYGTHGIHEYRGKFFPQLVNSLINISTIKKSAIIADPMCGSGTTLVEASHRGYRSIGLDMNPLSVFVAQTKCELLSNDPEMLQEEYDAVLKVLCKPSAMNGYGLEHYSSLSDHDRQYLLNWFPENFLEELDFLVGTLENSEVSEKTKLPWASLSNILRKISWQKDEDLRVRKDLSKLFKVGPIEEFLAEYYRSVRSVIALNRQFQSSKIKGAEVANGDARNLTHVWSQFENSVDLVITSPPYATALPYLDTDRLSLYYLGMLGRRGHRSLDKEMIGNREISNSDRHRMWSDFLRYKHTLPDRISSLIEKIYRLNDNDSAGFRRKNLPALLYKYFRDMEKVFSGVSYVMKRGGVAHFVVGRNHTIAGGKKIVIDTPSLLCELAEKIGLLVTERLSMEMLVSRDIFRNNASDVEEVIMLKKP